MIASLKGRVQHIGEDHLVLELSGVGYLVQASARTLARLQPDAALFLHIETQVREDAITLFGFPTEEERDWFRLLTTVQGVGGRVALAILGVLAPAEIASAITLEDKAVLTRAPGVGPRIAARMLTELKGKVPAFAISSDTAAPAAVVASGSAARDALSALQNLGFRPADASRAIAESLRTLGEDTAAEPLIRDALKRLSR